MISTTLFFCSCHKPKTDIITPAKQLIERQIGERAQSIHFEYIEPSDGKDIFEVIASDGRAEQYDVWPHFMLLSFYLFVIIGIGMIVVSLWDKSPQLGILNMEKIEDKPARIVLILWGLLIVTMIGLYIFFNGH